MTAEKATRQAAGISVCVWWPITTPMRKRQSCYYYLWFFQNVPQAPGSELYKEIDTKTVSHSWMFASKPSAYEGMVWLCHLQRLMCCVVSLCYIKHCNGRQKGKLSSLQSTGVVKTQLNFQGDLEEVCGWLTINFSCHSLWSWMPVICLYQQR